MKRQRQMWIIMASYFFFFWYYCLSLYFFCRYQIKYFWSEVKVTQSCLTPWTIQSMEFSRPECWSGYPFPSPGDLPNPGIEPKSPLQTDSLPAEPQGKPKKTGVGSLSLFQEILPIQELNQGLLHCKRTPYQPSYQGSPKYVLYIYKALGWPLYILFYRKR